jgi:hypothetical protein
VPHRARRTAKRRCAAQQLTARHARHARGVLRRVRLLEQPAQQPNSRVTGSWYRFSENVFTWMTWPATEIVRNWVSGAWANDGVIVQDFDVVFRTPP